jgi:hypothetical protein
MVRFASDCRDAMMIVTRKLEVTRGLTPQRPTTVCTADLQVFYGEITLPALEILLNSGTHGVGIRP